MKTTTKLLILLVSLAACGDNKDRPDARQSPDGPPADAQCSNCPAAPTLGTQIDRMGRPAINTLLNHGFDGTSAAGPAKDAYNADANKATWPATYLDEFKNNLGVLDAIDTGVCGNGRCEVAEFKLSDGTSTACNASGEDCAGTTPSATNNGCGTTVLYNGGAGGAPAADSYNALAGLLASDELWLDPSKGVCGLYFAVEFGVVISGQPSGGNTTCGGRAPQYDVIDFSLSAIAMGIPGFSADGLFTPKIGDGVTAHDDYLPTFPYLGEPHTP
jgi:hypothetical protein